MKQLNLSPELLEDLQRVEEVVQARVAAQSAVAAIVGQRMLPPGGTRLRAALTLLAAQLGTYRLDDTLHAAAAVELIQIASLLHNDLVDEARRRRGIVPEAQGWQHSAALMVGDYFFALSAGEMALAPDSRVIGYFAHAVMTICEGGLAPVMQTQPLETALEQYYYKIGCKTAALFAAACKAGMAIGGGSDAEIERLGSFGYDLGLAWQVVDDLLDFGGDAASQERPPGSSLRQGVITLPLIYAVDAGGGAELAAAVDAQDAAQVDQAIATVARLGGARTRDAVQRLAARALERLTRLPASPARQTLEDIAHFVTRRAP